MATKDDYLDKKISKIEAVRQLRESDEISLSEAVRTVEFWEGKDTTRENLVKLINEELSTSSYETVRSIARILGVI